MGNVPGWAFTGLGVLSVFAGIFIIGTGTALLFAAAKGAFKIPKTYDAAAAVDVGKLLEALSKLPQWAVAVMLGNLQILMGFWMLGATLFGYRLLP